MNYQKIYSALIEGAQNRILVGIYTERHHVVPRCMGGSDDSSNLVDLTAEEHYIAHQLLVKIHPKIYGLIVAAALMSIRCTGNKAYGWIRRRAYIASCAYTHSQGIRQQLSEISKRKWADAEWAANQSAVRQGKIASPETRAKMSAARVGENGCWYGKTFSDDHRAKLSAARAGKYGGDRHPQARAVICISPNGTETRFSTGKDAVQWLRDNGHPKAAKSAIVYACSEYGRSAYKRKWRYADSIVIPELSLEFE